MGGKFTLCLGFGSILTSTTSPFSTLIKSVWLRKIFCWRNTWYCWGDYQIDRFMLAIVCWHGKSRISWVAFQKMLKEFNCKPKRIWANKGSEFYNRSMKSQLEKMDIEMYSTHNEGKSVVAERFIRTLKIKFINT